MSASGKPGDKTGIATAEGSVPFTRRCVWLVRPGDMLIPWRQRRGVGRGVRLQSGSGSPARLLCCFLELMACVLRGFKRLGRDELPSG